MRIFLLLFVCLISPIVAVGDSHTIYSIDALKKQNENTYSEKFLFSITGLVTRSSAESIVLDDEGKRVCILKPSSLSCPHVGDVLLVTGHADLGPITKEKFLFLSTMKKIGSRPVPPICDITPKNLLSQDMDYALVRIRGCIIDVFKDEIDPRNIYLILNSEGESVYITLPNSAETTSTLIADIGAEVEITGECSMRNAGRRMFVGRHINTKLQNIRILRKASKDPFESPQLEDIYNVSPTEIAGMSRRTISGHVLASWHGNQFLLQSTDNRIIKVELANPNEQPDFGQRVKAVGFPQTDLFHINLTRAFCRSANSDVSTTPQCTPLHIKVSDIITSTNDNNIIDTTYHGKLICVKGIARTVSTSPENDAKINLESSGLVIPIDLSSVVQNMPDIPVGSVIEVIGICVIEGKNWQPSMVFPTLGGFTIVLRTVDDLQILSRPPWWTPMRLALIIISLLTTIVAILIWNRILKNIISHRTKQLLKEEIERAEADLRADERTRLSVEIHDSLSQNLSGVACQLAALRTFITTNSTLAQTILVKAERMLLSCRTELKRCLWDLRANTLEEPKLADAIRKTIFPVLQNCKLTIRFNVARSKLSDSLAHTIICIIRELVSNAVRHGKASHIRIAGKCHNDQISFSVRDNGSGFDPLHRLRTEDGHFGLDGITERVMRHAGKFTIDSNHVSGTKAIVSFLLPDATQGENVQ